MTGQQSVLGIDFGESKISAAIYNDKGFRTITNSTGGNNLAACVFFCEKDEFLTGQNAIKHADLWPSGYASRFKSCLLLNDKKEFNKFIREKEPHYNTENSPAFTLTAMDGTKVVKKPAELLTLLFEEIRRLAKDSLGPHPSCIVTYPDAWNAESRNKIAGCLAAAGFEKCGFIYDYRAILLGYYMKTMPSTAVDVNIIVDVGYEDCRVSLHTFSRGEDSFSTTKAKLPYGGRAIDAGLLKFCGEEFMRINRFDFRENPEAVLRVLLACEAAKIQLSTSRSVTVSVKQVLRGKDLECVVSVEDFRKICGPIAAKIIDAIRSRAEEYEKEKYALLLVGGGSRVPIIRELINYFFKGHVNTSVQFYADEAALLGAAGQAAAFVRNVPESSVRATAEVLSQKEQLPENDGRHSPSIPTKNSATAINNKKLPALENIKPAGSFRTQGDRLEDHKKVDEHCHYSDNEKNRQHHEPNKMNSQTSSNDMNSSENLTTQITEEDKAGTKSSFNTPEGENEFHLQNDIDGQQDAEKESHARRDPDMGMSSLEDKEGEGEGDEFFDTAVDQAEISPPQNKPSRRTSEQDCQNTSEGSCVPSNLTTSGLASAQQGSHPNPYAHASVDHDNQVTAPLVETGDELGVGKLSAPMQAYHSKLQVETSRATTQSRQLIPKKWSPLFPIPLPKYSLSQRGSSHALESVEIFGLKLTGYIRVANLENHEELVINITYYKGSLLVCRDKVFASYYSSPSATSGIDIFKFSFKTSREDVTGANFFISYQFRDGKNYRDINNMFDYELMVVTA